MRETEFRILDILSREIGNPISIKKIKEKINEIHGHAHYPAIYSKIQEMEKNKTINIDIYGKSSAASLNFANPLMIDNLAQIELINKIHFLESRTDWQTLILQINGYLREFTSIRSITMIKPEQYAKLNRMELLILAQDRKNIEAIHKIMDLLEKIHNIRIDFMMLEEEGFKDLLRREDANMIKEILSDKITIFYPQTFWLLIKKFLDEGLKIQVEELVNPAKISDDEISYNLNRFGYQEFGTRISTQRSIGIEYITTAILLKGDARKKNSIPIILAKNSEKTDYDLLVFLAKKYSTLDLLLPYLKILYESRPNDRLREHIHFLKRSNITETKIDVKDIKKKMRLYNVE